MNEIRYETPSKDINFGLPTIFLAGPTVRGNQPHLTSWRFEAVDIFKKKKFEGNIIIPEFTDRKESDKDKFDLPIWEYEGLSNSDVNMFWIPRTRELIGLTTNHEHGVWMIKNRHKMIYGRPDDAYRIKYLDIMWEEDAKRRIEKVSCNIYSTLESTIDAALKLVKKRLLLKPVRISLPPRMPYIKIKT